MSRKSPQRVNGATGTLALESVAHARAASTGCVGTGEVDARCIPFAAWLRQMGFPHYELSAKGCTADEALRAEVS